MAEIPGMIRPELQALPQISDRMTFIYLEHCVLNRQDGAITVTDDRGTLFPAHAGVILNDWKEIHTGFPFPRTRGGDPSAAAP